MKLYAIGTQTRQKIGISKEPQNRLRTLQTANAEKLELFYEMDIPEKMARKIEKYIHNEYRHLKLKGEWFEMSPDDVKSFLRYEEMMLESNLSKMK